MTPLDILPFPFNEYANFEKKNEQYAKQADKGSVRVNFWTKRLGLGSYEEGKVSCSKKIQVATKRRWTFSSSTEDKWQCLQAGLAKWICNISITFNVVDLSLFDVGNRSDLRMNPFEEGGNNRGATSPSNDPLHGIGGPMTRS